jgi:hypothetical protein
MRAPPAARWPDWIQINTIVPPTISTGAAVSLTVSGGTAATARRSQANVTVAVQ